MVEISASPRPLAYARFGDLRIPAAKGRNYQGLLASMAVGSLANFSIATLPKAPMGRGSTFFGWGWPRHGWPRRRVAHPATAAR